MFKFLVAAGVAFGAPAAHALPQVVFHAVHDYGKGDGKVNPGGNDFLYNDSVVVSDQSSSRFSDSFTFGTNPLWDVKSFDLALKFDGAGPSSFFGIPKETWRARIQGSNSSAASDDYFAVLFDAQSPQQITISMATDTGSIDAFAHTVSTGMFEFWFSEGTLFKDACKLDSAELKVNAHVIPLPAAAWMLMAAAGGLVAAKRRAKSAA